MKVKNDFKELYNEALINPLKQNFISDFETNTLNTAHIIDKTTSQNLNLFIGSENPQGNFANEETEKKPEDLNYGKFSMLLSNFCFSLSAISLKILNNSKKNYSYNLFSAIRFFVIFFAFIFLA